MSHVLIAPDGGWLKVRAGVKEGLVPTSYVEIFPATPPSSAGRPASTYSASSVSLAGSITQGSSAASKKKGPAVAPKRGAKKLKYVEAMYDYTAQSDAEHSMVAGEKFVLVNKDAGDGWADVEKGGITKSVPANYIQEV
jgi:formin-binding protein 1